VSDKIVVEGLFAPTREEVIAERRRLDIEELALLLPFTKYY